MTEADRYALDEARTLVWSGLWTAAEVRLDVAEIAAEEGADPAATRARVDALLAQKAEAEAGWPAVTDCDRLDRAFAALNAAGVVALHDAGFTQTDGHTEVAEAAADRPGAWAYAFYHSQDVAGAIDGDGLWIAFGALDGSDAVPAGGVVRAALGAEGLRVVWNGDPRQRLHLPALDWRRWSPT